MTSGTTKYSTDQIMEMLYQYERGSIGKPLFKEDQQKITKKLIKNGIELAQYTTFVLTVKEPSSR